MLDVAVNADGSLRSVRLLYDFTLEGAKFYVNEYRLQIRPHTVTPLVGTPTTVTKISVSLSMTISSIT